MERRGNYDPRDKWNLMGREGCGWRLPRFSNSFRKEAANESGVVEGKWSGIRFGGAARKKIIMNPKGGKSPPYPVEAWKDKRPSRPGLHKWCDRFEGGGFEGRRGVSDVRSVMKKNPVQL